MDWGETDEKVIRPALPLLLFPLAGIWVGLLLAQSLVWRGLTLSPVALYTLLVVSGAAGLFVVLGQSLPKAMRPGTLAIKKSDAQAAKRPGALAAKRPGKSTAAVSGLSAPRAIAVLITSALLGFSVGMLFWVTVEDAALGLEGAVLEPEDAALELEDASLKDKRQSYSMRIVEDPQQGALSQTSVALIRISETREARVRIFWDAAQEPLPLGATFVAEADFKALNEQQGFLHKKGIAGSATVSTITQVKFPDTILGKIYSFREDNRRILQEKEGEGAALLQGILLGNSSGLNSTEAGRAYKASGLSHLIAISGSHLVVIAMLFSWLIKKLRLSRPLEVLLITSFLISFVFLTGLQPSAIRACIMTFVASVAPLMGRRAHAPSALATAGVGMMLVFPPTAFSVGFWLSMFAVFGLTIFCPLVSRYLFCLFPRFDGLRYAKGLTAIKKAILEPFALTITAQLTTVAITASLFSTISIVSPLANLLVTPLITILVGAGIATLCLLPLLGPLGALLIDGLCSVADLSINIAKFCSSIPYACMPVACDLTVSIVVFLALASILYLVWPQPSKKRSLRLLLSVVLVSSLLIVSAFFPVHPQVVVLDVGQGDAILIREGTTNVLIDTGKSENLLLKGLARQRITHIDAIVITHLDEDHCGALRALEGTMSVSHVYFAEGLLDKKHGDKTISAAESLLASKTPESLAFGDRLYLAQKVSLLMVWPDHSVFQGSNEESICLYLIYDANGDSVPESTVLLTGDAESSELEQILKKPKTTHVDVLKLGHHGSKRSVTGPQLNNMECLIALISVGANNRYGHPSTDVIKSLQDVGVAIYRTDLNGDIVLLFDGQRLFVRCDTMSSELDDT